ncbi:D-aminoacyl-tRNA deacylase 1 isoform X4 [Cavia porcellus]
MDKQFEVLCVSQFTLQCVLKGSKPDFHLAMPAEQAEGFYNSFLEQLRKTYRPELIKDGKFGAYMQVHIQNDGPVTIELESPAPSAAISDPKQLSKLEKQQQRKEKIRAKGPSESSKERTAPRKEDCSASSGAEGYERPEEAEEHRMRNHPIWDLFVFENESETTTAQRPSG